MQYKTVYQNSTAEIVEKKSRFIANVFPVYTEEEAALCLEKIRKQHWDAKHHCWAYVIGSNQQTERCSDDGEPGKTAGKPILEVIKGQKLKNVLVVVTRYFGGTLLGTGGLVRAYSGAAKEGLLHNQIITKIWGIKLKVFTDYTGLGKIQHMLAQSEIPILHTEYTDSVELSILIPEEQVKAVENELTEGTNGKSKIELGQGCWYSQIQKEIIVWQHEAFV